MKQRLRLFKRGNVFHYKETEARKQFSLGHELDPVAASVANVIDWSETGLITGTIFNMTATTSIAASEAKAKFSELLDRVRGGESFCITLHGQEAARLVPARRPGLGEIQEAIAQMKASRSVLNRPGQAKLKSKDLVSQGRR